MPGIETVNATEFKAKCLNILDRLASREIERAAITERGRTVGVLTAPPPADADSLFGCMRGSVVIPDGFDLTAPALDEPLGAGLGILHR